MGYCQLSVIIPCHDDGHYLVEAIESVLSQESTVDPVEILIIDDSSTDTATLQVLSHLRENVSKVEVMNNTQRSGAAGARNFGISRAKGEWIAFLDADDVWTSGSLAARWQVIEMHPEVEWLSADFIYLHEGGIVDERGFFETNKVTHKFFRHAFETGLAIKLSKPVNEFIEASLAYTCTTIVKKNLFQRVGYFNQNLRCAEDTNLWLRLATYADYFFVPKICAQYRQHPKSLTHNDEPPAKWRIESIHLLKKDPEFKRYRQSLQRKLADLYNQNTYYHRARDEKRLALKAAVNAVTYRPSEVAFWKGLLGAILGRK